MIENVTATRYYNIFEFSPQENDQTKVIIFIPSQTTTRIPFSLFNHYNNVKIQNLSSKFQVLSR